MEILNSLANFLISPAHADAAPASAAQAQGGGYSLVLLLVFMFLIMYLFAWRPQNKRAREHRNLLGSLAKGDEVVTAGGILGKITKISDHYAVISLADNVEITIQKSSIVSALPKGTLKSI